MREIEKIDQIIETLCDEIQSRINAGYVVTAAKLTKALAMLIAAKADLDMSVRMREGKKSIQAHQMQ